MKTTHKIMFGLLALIAAFAFGRYSVQKSSVHIIEDVTQNTDTDTTKDTHKHTTTITTKNPNGSETTTTTTDEDTTSDKKQTQETQTHIDQTITPPKINTLSLSALGGLNFSTGKPVYGTSVTKQILGPISIGAWGLTNSTVGMSIGISF